MTLSAWVKPTQFPVNDAAMISSLTNNELGYQLDLTVDEGPRTIGFKIADAYSRLMARYGNTPVVQDRWYHVAGVYDCEARTLDVYLNGARDNGCLIGTVTDRQLPSRRGAFNGRRVGMAGFEFIGAIDEARIESRAQSANEISAEASRELYPGNLSPVTPLETDQSDASNQCNKQLPHARVAGPLLSLGMLIAAACAGVFGGTSFVSWTLGLCFVAGSTAVWSSLPSAVSLWSAMWCVPLGGLVVLTAGAGSKAAPGGRSGSTDDSVDPPDAAA